MSKQLFYNQLLQEEKELQEALEAVRTLKKRYVSEDSPQKSISFDDASHNIEAATLEGYDKAWILPEKVHYGLKQIKKGTVDDVVEVLVKLDSSFSQDKAKRVTTNHLSKLYRASKIGATKIGNKYRYFIKE